MLEYIRAEEDELNHQQEDSQGNYEGMKIILEKKIQLYKRCLNYERKIGRPITKLDHNAWVAYLCSPANVYNNSNGLDRSRIITNII
jgi:hypothetical protein